MQALQFQIRLSEEGYEGLSICSVVIAHRMWEDSFIIQYTICRKLVN